jgi:hypothetical protein
MTKTAKERWSEIERQAWVELSKEGDLGEVRFKQRCGQIAKRAGWDEDAIQIMLSGKPLTDAQKAARRGK